MSDIHIEHQHSFDFETARSQAKKWLEHAKNEMGLDIDYQEGTDSDTAKISKAGVDATAILDKDKVVFDAKLGFLAKPFKSIIDSGIKDGLQQFFA